MSKRKLLIWATLVFASLIVMGTVAWLQGSYRGDTEGLSHLNFQLDWVMGSYYAPYVLADKLGFYSEEGLTVEFIQGKGAETTAKLISQGTQVIGTGNAAATAVAVSQGLEVISVAMIDKEAVTSIFSLSQKGINEPKDLVGKTVGVRYYDISHSEYLAMMHIQGINTKEVREVGVGFDLQPLILGQIDAMYNYFYNLPVRLKEAGYDTSEIMVKDWGVHGYGANIIANRRFLKENGDVVQRFLRASAKGWERAASHPEEAIAALVERYPEVDKTVALESLKSELTVVSDHQGVITLCQSKVRWEETLDTYEKVALLKADLSVDSIYTNAYLYDCGN